MIILQILIALLIYDCLYEIFVLINGENKNGEIEHL